MSVRARNISAGQHRTHSCSPCAEIIFPALVITGKFRRFLTNRHFTDRVNGLTTPPSSAFHRILYLFFDWNDQRIPVLIQKLTMNVRLIPEMSPSLPHRVVLTPMIRTSMSMTRSRQQIGTESLGDCGFVRMTKSFPGLSGFASIRIPRITCCHAFM